MNIKRKIAIILIFSSMVTVLFFFSATTFFESLNYRNIEISIKPIYLLQINNRGILENTQIINREEFIDKFTKNVVLSNKCDVKIISNKKIVINDYYLGIEKKDIEILQIRLRQDNNDCSNDLKTTVEMTQLDIVEEFISKVSLVLDDKRFNYKEINSFIFLELQLKRIIRDIKNYTSYKESTNSPKLDKFGLTFLIFLASIVLMSCLTFYKNPFKGP
jgi:hypothetical protein